VEYPTLAFHYGNFDASDYGGIYSTKEDAAADGFFYADTTDFTNDTFGSVATNVPVAQEWTTTTITMQNTILEIPKFGRNEVNKGIILEFPNLTSEVPNSGNNGFNLYIRKYTGVGGTQYHRVQIGAVSGNAGAGNIYIFPDGPQDVPFGNFDYIKVWLTIDNKVKRTVSVNNTISTGEWNEYNDDQPWQIEFTGFQGTTSDFTFRYKYLDNTGEVTSDPNYGGSVNTVYTWTPSSAITADVLMVAGGGGGGAGAASAGGGAGGLLFYPGETLNAQKTIVVGNGGSSLDSIYYKGFNGSNTYFSGLTTVIGGGAGGSYGDNSASQKNGNNGGSGGGAGHADTSGVVVGQGESGPPRQGYNGGTSSGNQDGGGGGGSGGVGGNGSSGNGGNGGLGTDLTATFGTKYGDSGYFASGGGGGARSLIPGTASIGGGSSSKLNANADDAQSHTGGGGGAGGSGSYGGNGGSGIVLVKQTSFLLVATFSDEWTSGTTTVALGSTFNLPTVTNITGVKRTGSVDSNTVGTYDVTWSKVVDGFLRSITRRFVVAEPFRYLAFYGDDFGTDRGIFYELELSLATPFTYNQNTYNNIKYNEALPVATPVESDSWSYFGTFNKYETVFDGIKSPDPDGVTNLQFLTSSIPVNGAVLFYMDMGSPVLVSSGEYWTFSEANFKLGSGKLYGTNTNPSTLTSTQRTDESNYTFICNLTRNEYST
jgi:hypothetical protein